MVADELAADDDVRHELQAVAHLLAAAGDRGERLASSGRSRKTRSISSSIVGGQQARALLARVVGREVRVGDVRPEHRVHAPDDLAELAEVARARAPGRSRARRAPCPSRRGRRARAPGRRRASRRAARPRARTSRAGPATFSKPRLVRKRTISSSGLSPASRRRNTFSTADSSMTIDVLDCSAPMRRTRSAASGSPDQWNAITPCSPWTRASPVSSRASARAGAGVREPSPRGRRARRAAGRGRACPAAKRASTSASPSGGSSSSASTSRSPIVTSRALDANQRCADDPVGERVVVDGADEVSFRRHHGPPAGTRRSRGARA